MMLGIYSQETRVMILRLACSLSCFLLVAGNLQADKFFLDTPKVAAATQGNRDGRVIEGVLKSETKSTYTVRIPGGEVVIAKSLVQRHVKDDLSMDQIIAQEKAQADRNGQANKQRRTVQAIEASASRSKKPAAPPRQEKNLTITVDFQNLLPNYKFRAYDPVLRRANFSGLRQVIEDYLRREVKTAAHRQ